MDDLSLLPVRVDGVIVESQTGGIRGSLFIECIPAVGAPVASFLVNLGGHVGVDVLSVPHSRHRGFLGLYSRVSTRFVASVG